MMAVDHMGRRAVPHGPLARQGFQEAGAEEQIEAVVAEPDPEAVADQAGGDSVKDLAKKEAARLGDGDDGLLEVSHPRGGQGREAGAFDFDAVFIAGVDAAHDSVEEELAVALGFEVAGAAQGQFVLDGAFEMAAGSFDGAVPMGHAPVVARGRHAVMAAQRLEPVGGIVPVGFGEVPEGG